MAEGLKPKAKAKTAKVVEEVKEADAKDLADLAADGVADGLRIVGEESLAAEQAIRAMDRAQLAYIAMGIAAGAAIGGLIAFRVAYKRAEGKYNALMTEELEALKEHYDARQRAPKPELGQVVEELGYTSVNDGTTDGVAAEMAAPIPPPPAIVEVEVVDDQPPVPTDKTKNVFENTDVWDYADEIKGRDHNYPYIIHFDEHRTNEKDYRQRTFTYFEGDNILVDETEQVVSHVDDKIGDHNLARFGHGSNDANVVYVRNEQLEEDYEIIRSHGHYAVEVLGLDTPGEIKHSEDRRMFDDE